MPPKRVPINTKINDIVVKSNLAPNDANTKKKQNSLNIKTNMNTEDIVSSGRTKVSKKPVKQNVKQNDSDEEEDSDEVDSSDVETEDEAVKNSEEEDEDKLDDDVDHLGEEKEKEKDDAEEIDDDDEEDLADDIKDDEEDKSINDENISGTIDINDCLLDDEENVDELGEATMVDPANRISRPRLTKYERVRVLASRTKQLAMGAPPLVKNVFGKSPIEIAEIELHFNMIPFKIKRPMPNNTYEIWKLSELDK